MRQPIKALSVILLISSTCLAGPPIYIPGTLHPRLRYVVDRMREQANKKDVPPRLRAMLLADAAKIERKRPKFISDEKGNIRILESKD